MSETDDERAREREVILQRRAKLVAYAVAAGVATVACSGKTFSSCLSIAIGASGGVPTTTGGRSYCLSIPRGGASTGGVSYGGVAGGDTDGGVSYCLSGSAGCLQPPFTAGAAGEGASGAAGEGGASGGSGSDDVPPFGGTSVCLVPPA